MKKNFRYILAAMAAVATVSCSSEFDGQEVVTPEVNEKLVPMTITVGSDDTRVFVGEDNKSICWTATDCLAVYESSSSSGVGASKRKFSIKEESINGTTATFYGETSESVSEVYLAYPHDAVERNNGTRFDFVLPTTQQLGDYNVADNALLAIGHYTLEGAAQLSNVVGFLRVDITLDDVESVVVNGTNIAGTATITGKTAEMYKMVDANNTVTLLPKGDVFEKGSYWVALFPSTTPAGEFRVIFNRTSEIVTSYTASKEVTIVRNGGFKITDYKWEKSGKLIKDAASLMEFLANCSQYGEAEFANDIDLDGVTLTSAENYEGVLDCKGFALKNWNATAPLFKTLAGTVKNLEIDSSCTLTPADAAGAFGFVATTVKTAGVLDNIENNATVLLNATKYAAGSSQTTDAVYFGVLAGENFGKVQNCTNNGNITITATTATGTAERGLVYIGGLVGIFDNQAQFVDDSAFVGLYNNTNNGNITYSVNGNTGFAYIGGVAGGTTAVKISSSSVTEKGNIDKCTNTGNIYYTFNNGGEMENGTAHAVTTTASNYTNMGGVIGYCEGNVTNCTNGVENNTQKGEVKFVAPVVTADYSASRVSVAGVCGYVYHAVSNCNNHGKIYAKGSFNKGANNAGCGKLQGITVAGVIGQMGVYAAKDGLHSISNCHNKGVLDCNLLMAPDEQTPHYVGGVVAYAYANVQNCSNSALVTVVTSGQQNYLGGVVGCGLFDINTVTNNGTINYTLKRLALISGTTNNCLNNANNCLGGVVGQASDTSNDKVLTTANNNGAVNITVVNECTKKTLGTQFKGAGVVGYAYQVNGATNNGAVTINECYNSSTQRWAGVIGATSGSVSITGAHNKGTLSYTGATAKDLYIGGVAGNIPGGTITLSSNTHNITVNVTTMTGTLYMGGIAGYSKSGGDCKEVSNSGNLSANNGKTARMGGIFGMSEAKTIYTSITNSGTITYNSGATEQDEFRVGGICGYSYNASEFNSCSNSAAISITAGGATVGHIGGIVGSTNGDSNSVSVTDSTSEGNITVACPAQWYAGGVLGHGGVWNSTTTNHRLITGNTVTADITIGTTNTSHYVGGLVGLCGIVTEISGNSYTGAISVGANANNMGHVGGIMGAAHLNASTESATAPVSYTVAENTIDADITYATTDYYGLISGGSFNKKTSVTTVPSVNYELVDNVIKLTSSLNGVAVSSANTLVGERNDGLFTNVVTGGDTTKFE